MVERFPPITTSTRNRVRVRANAAPTAVRGVCPLRLYKFRTRRLESSRHHFAHSLDEFVSECVVFLAIFTQNRAVEKEGCCPFCRASREAPNIRGEKPRPAQQITVADRVDSDGFTISSDRLENDLASLNQTIRRFALAKDNVVAIESDAHRTIGQQTNVMLI